MLTYRMRTVCVMACVCACAHNGFALDAMVLLMRPDDGSLSYNGTPGALVLRYMSTGEEIELVGCCVQSAKFSPDGKKVAYKDGGGTHTINIDGSGGTSLSQVDKVREWCADGRIYTQHGGFSETGGALETIVFPYRRGRCDNFAPGGGLHKPRGYMYVSMDGTRAQTDAFGYNGAGGVTYQTVILLQEGKEFAVSRPCEGMIGPHGNKLGKATASHNQYFIYPWGMIYRYTTVGGRDNCTYNAGVCRGTEPLCPWYLDTTELVEHNEIFHSLTWGRNGDVIASCTREMKLWLYRLSTNEKLVYDGVQQAEDIYGYPKGYIPREIRMDDTSMYLTPNELACETEIGDEQMPKLRTVYVKASHTLPTPTLMGVPAWLNVQAEAFDDDNARMVNTINPSGVPASPGTYTATIAVSFEGYRAEHFLFGNEYTVTLDVFEQRPEPIRFTGTFEQRYNTGSTIDIEYSADCERAGDKVAILLSVDNGAGWGIADTTRLGRNCGENQTFSFVVADSMEFFKPHEWTGEVNRYVQGSQCMVKLMSYHPGGTEVVSPLFGINENVAATASSRVSVVRNVPLRAMLKSSSGAALLSLRSPRAGMARLLDIQGRTVARFAVARGEQAVALPLSRAGCYLVEVRYTTGSREVAAVNLL